MLMVHIMVYSVFVAAVLVYLLVSLVTGRHKQYRRPTIFGLLASPIGLVVPYLLFMLVVLAGHHSWPFDGIPIIDPIARVLVPALQLLGPLIGPPLVLFLTIRFMKKQGSV